MNGAGLSMKGGTIAGNSFVTNIYPDGTVYSDGNGVGVYIDETGSFTMSGGTIRRNRSSLGGDV